MCAEGDGRNSQANKMSPVPLSFDFSAKRIQSQSVERQLCILCIRNIHIRRSTSSAFSFDSFSVFLL